MSIQRVDNNNFDHLPVWACGTGNLSDDHQATCLMINTILLIINLNRFSQVRSVIYSYFMIYL